MLVPGKNPAAEAAREKQKQQHHRAVPQRKLYPSLAADADQREANRRKLRERKEREREIFNEYRERVRMAQEARRRKRIHELVRLERSRREGAVLKLQARTRGMLQRAQVRREHGAPLDALRARAKASLDSKYEQQTRMHRVYMDMAALFSHLIIDSDQPASRT